MELGQELSIWENCLFHEEMWSENLFNQVFGMLCRRLYKVVQTSRNLISCQHNILAKTFMQLWAKKYAVALHEVVNVRVAH